VNKNWANGFRVDYKSSFDLTELIGIDANLKKRLEEFEGAFERNEIVNIKTFFFFLIQFFSSKFSQLQMY
jgi:hypothetical protein